jgi:hypothetical protein
MVLSQPPPQLCATPVGSTAFLKTHGYLAKDK